MVDVVKVLDFGLVRRFARDERVEGRTSMIAPQQQDFVGTPHFIAPEALLGDGQVDGRTDLYAYNANDWSEEYLGTLLSSGRSLDGGFQADWIGSWNLGNGDRFVVANFNGGSGWDDLLVHNDDWFGLLRSRSRSVSLSAIHPRWIHDHRFHSAGWW
jgi:serine/threonine protein kinase